MFINEKEGADARVSRRTALRHLLVFQLKLAADALRDFLLSPLSVVAFALDVVRKPRVENSLYLRLMLLGRRSDRVINLFDDHRDSDGFTIDRAVDELEEIVRSAKAAKSVPRAPGKPQEPEESREPKQETV
jgi:hypothetical protein